MNESAITYKYTVSEIESVYIAESVNRYFSIRQGDAGVQLYQSRINWTLVHEFDGEQDIIATWNSMNKSYIEVHDLASVYINDFIGSGAINNEEATK